MAESPPPASCGQDCRCACGSLVARLVDGGVELKCRRCKRTLLVPLTAGTGAGTGVPASDPPAPIALREAG